ncbi:hypothetical protein L596_027551 [Steinernema carpocapsae]|uniref:Uncharacterized protein n=1 Tax=Steinernema carpocapsae TaxID=34508 RepID=A0A4U5LVS4_STECR|nr:hypothetical protein L596_027551 [Steinernema carpocapsae]
MSFSSFTSTSTNSRRAPPVPPHGSHMVNRNPGIVITHASECDASSIRGHAERPHTLNVDTVNAFGVVQVEPLSVSPRVNVTYLKKRYSREDSLLGMEMPVFDKSQMVQKKGPSSPTTVLTMAGLFIVGVTLILSGIIVFTQQREAEFLITAGIFVGVGLLMLVVCLVLQWKNVVKYFLDLNRDFYFLSTSENNKWKMAKGTGGTYEEQNNLPIPNSD